MPLLLMESELDLHTRRENQVVNLINRRPIRPGDEIASADFKLKYPYALHRPTRPSRKYNCHGLTFASRRTWIDQPAEIVKILTDDDYEKIDALSVLPGDIAIYRLNGIIEHSGIVVGIKKEVPQILSKWAAMHEVVHGVRDCPYYDCEILFYRIVI